MRFYIHLVHLLLISQLAQAQMFSIEGLVKDEQTQTPLSFAHITVCNESLGTSTNEEGRFKIHLPNSSLKDTLCISFIGYQMKRIPIQTIKLQAPLRVALEPNTFALNEIAITENQLPDPAKLVKKAIQKIRKNYPTHTYLLEGYYRDYLKNKEGYHNAWEAAIGIYDPGFQVSAQQQRVKVYQSRHTNGYPLNYGELYENNLGGRSGHINIVGGNELAVLMYNNPVRNYNRNSDIQTGYELDDEFLIGHDLSLDYATYLEDRLVYCVRLKANLEHRHFRSLQFKADQAKKHSLEGKIYIQADNHAIVRLEYVVNVWEANAPKKLNEVLLEYKPFQGEMYLNYMSFTNLIKVKSDFETHEYLHVREFFVNNTRTENLPSSDTFYLFSKIQQLYEQENLTDPSFWKHYNLVLKKTVN